MSAPTFEQLGEVWIDLVVQIRREAKTEDQWIRLVNLQSVANWGLSRAGMGADNEDRWIVSMRKALKERNPHSRRATDKRQIQTDGPMHYKEVL